MKFRRYLFILACIAFCTPLIARETVEDAWREYDYQNFDGAARIFGEVLKSKISAPDEKLQARLGIAMVMQYRMPGADPARAIPLYRAVLDSLPGQDSARANVLLLLGRAYVQMKKPLHDSATVCFNKIIADYPASIESDQAALEEAYILSYCQTEPDFRKALRFVQDYCAKYPANTMASTMHMFCANMLIPLGEWEQARGNLMAADSLGVNNKRLRPVVIFQIGQISDKKLGDRATAKVYFRKLLDIYPSDYLSYFCRVRLRELGEK